MINEKCVYFKSYGLHCDSCHHYKNGFCDIDEIVENGEKYFLKGSYKDLKEFGLI